MTAPALEWPALPLQPWAPTRATLHMWTQIVGKVRLALSAYQNHWWQVPLYVGARGLSTTAIPYRGGNFEIEFDFIDHHLLIRTSEGKAKALALKPRSVAAFHAALMAALRDLGIAVRIWTMPVEIPSPIRFEKDEKHASYDPEAVNRFWRALTCADAALKEFRGRFIGKCSPVHFFWGSFDLAVTRFSGRRARPIEGADAITREAYSHEVSSVGWWPGDAMIAAPAFYTYASPQPPGFADAAVRPAATTFNPQLSQFLLMYDDARAAPSPHAAVLDFCQSTYEAAATLGEWDRAALER
jgi:hypothetical protein